MPFEMRDSLPEQGWPQPQQLPSPVVGSWAHHFLLGIVIMAFSGSAKPNWDYKLLSTLPEREQTELEWLSRGAQLQLSHSGVPELLSVRNCSQQ